MTIFPILTIELPSNDIVRCYLFRATVSTLDTKHGLDSCIKVLTHINTQGKDFVSIPPGVEVEAINTNIILLSATICSFISNLMPAFEFMKYAIIIDQTAFFFRTVAYVLSIVAISMLGSYKSRVVHIDAYIGTDISYGVGAIVLCVIIMLSAILPRPLANGDYKLLT